ncbi:MAG: ABC transporter ATP-binding protein [Nitrososphaerota archaeon]
MKKLLIEVKDLWKAYNGKSAVSGLSLNVSAGEIHGLIGLNGAGKTTTIKCIVGLLRADSGEIRVAGRDVYIDASYKSIIGYLPENPSLPEYLTLREFLIFVARIKGLSGSRADSEVWNKLALFELEEISDQLIYELSRGMKQRLAIAAAIINDPDILILDEPFSGLDPEAQRVTKRVMRETANKGGAVLISTHILDAAERFCNRATIVHKGRTLIEGAIDELKSQVGLGPNASLEEAFIKIISS